MKDPESNINKFNIVDYDIKSLGVPRGPAKWQPLKFPEKLFESAGSCESADEISPGEQKSYAFKIRCAEKSTLQLVIEINLTSTIS